MIVNQGFSAITLNLLILGGTTEATALCQTLAALDANAILSLAGRVDRPKRQPLPMRLGGFGGVVGLKSYLNNAAITHVVDATHPFASQVSHNAVTACADCNVPLVAFTRAPWTAVDGDTWQHVPDIPGAVAVLNRPRQRVLLAVGRMHLNAFAPNPQHHYVLRLVDPPLKPLPLPETTVIVDRGPFTVEGDMDLMRAQGIECVVSKNSGGTGAVAKITAARQLGLPVIMIDRPPMPARAEAHSVEAVLRWLRDHGANLGV